MSLIELGGEKCWLVARGGPPIEGRNAADLVGKAYGSEARNMVIPLERLHAEFLQLRSGVAGEVLQKLVNYGYRPAIVGDIAEAVAASDALRDFVRESNRGRHVWFVDDLDALAAKLGVA